MRHVKSTTSGASKTRRAAGAGRVVLAAIVHYGSSGGHLSEIPATGNSEKQPAMTEASRCSTPNTNPTDKSGLKRLGKLLFSRRKQQPQPQQTSATLIDDIPGGGNLRVHDQNGTANRESCAHQEPPKQQHANKKRAQTSDRNHQHREQVIEFKFDLIVDRKSGLLHTESRPSLPASPAEAPAVGCGGIHDWKLVEMLNELVGSSVLESNDVCVMSVGRQLQLQPQQQQQQVAGVDAYPRRPDFAYICQLAAHTLQYCFHLLEQSRLAQQADTDDGGWSPFEFSVELSASLVALGCGGAPTPPNNSPQARRRLQIVDLVAAGLKHDFAHSNGKSWPPEIDCDGSQQHPMKAVPLVVTGGGGGDESNELLESRSIDCWTCREALESLDTIRNELESEPTRHLLAKTDKRILLIGLKLKQRINGGLFSNRISLIDFEPKFVELHSILESAFNGQALAYLKRQQQQQQQQVAISGSPLWRPIERRLVDGQPSSVKAQVIGTRQQLKVDTADAEKDLFQQLDATKWEGEEEDSEEESLGRDTLARAEWLLYKQLSSALIRTLLVVHVHKLDRNHSSCITSADSKPSASISDEHLEKLQLQLMADNLLTLEFASSIQRASAMRLRRRKRHLRSHLASSSTSITSNLSTRKLQSPPTAAAAAASPYIGFPSDTCGPSYHMMRGRHQRKVSLMDDGLMLARHRARHRHLSTTTNTSSRQSLGRSRGVTGSGLRTSHKWSGPDFTESSSMSTSSGGNVAHVEDCLLHRSDASTAQSRVKEWQIQPLTGSARCYTDDSDSLASAYLESRSSSTSRHNHNHNHNNNNNSTTTIRSQHLKQSPIRWAQQQQQQQPKVPPQGSSIELGNLSRLRSMSQLHCKTNNHSSQSSSRAPTIKSHSRTSSVIKIDCVPSSMTAHTNEAGNRDNQTHAYCLTPDAGRTPNGFDLLPPDNVSVSELCTAVAEPPKQLKLEQFLNQIGNIINSPQHHALPVSETQTTTAATTGNECDISNSNSNCNTRRDFHPDISPLDNSSVHRQNNLNITEPSSGRSMGEIDRVDPRKEVEEDDEDCKSHSSILDHLSSMALESMAKLNNRGAGNQLVEEGSSSSSSSVQAANCGHLQRLLNSSQPQKMSAQAVCSNGSSGSHVALKDCSGIQLANRLKALSVNCATSSQCHHDLPNCQHENSPSPASFVHSSTSSSSGFSSAIAGSLDNNAKFQLNTNILPTEYLHAVTLAQPVESDNRKQQNHQQEQDRTYAKVMKAPSVM